MATLLLACGALAREVIAIRDRHNWDAVVLALPALLHNTPGDIPPAVKEAVEKHRDQFDRMLIIYGDCGTGGHLDAALDLLGLERISGPHCYEMYAGTAGFESLIEEEIGTFYLTDYLAQSFDHLVIEGLGLDRHPELRDVYFQNYRRMVYLQQRHDPVLLEKAHAAAEALNLPLEIRHTGYGELEQRIVEWMHNKIPQDAS